MKRLLLLSTICLLVAIVTKAHAQELFWVPTLCERADELHEEPLDIHALSNAIARQETGDCTTGVGLSKFNCHGIRKNGEYVTFDSPVVSHAYFRSMWLHSKIYSHRFPTCEEARTYRGYQDIDQWMTNVIRFYLSH